jgi:hypothetical protein
LILLLSSTIESYINSKMLPVDFSSDVPMRQLGLAKRENSWEIHFKFSPDSAATCNWKNEKTVCFSNVWECVQTKTFISNFFVDEMLQFVSLNQKRFEKTLTFPFNRASDDSKKFRLKMITRLLKWRKTFCVWHYL